MSASVSIPASFLARARRHLRRTGQPLLLPPRRPCADWGLLVEKNPASERWAVLFDPSFIAVLWRELEMVADPAKPEEEQGEGFTVFMEKLTRLAAVAVKDLPDRFECHGWPVGRMDLCDGVVFVSNTLALSCLSWVLRQQRTGFFLRL
jgi:hypothetical protein